MSGRLRGSLAFPAGAALSSGSRARREPAGLGAMITSSLCVFPRNLGELPSHHRASARAGGSESPKTPLGPCLRGAGGGPGAALASDPLRGESLGPR